MAELTAREINVPGSIRITQSYLFPHRVLDHSSLCLWVPSLTSSALAAGCRPEGQGGLREAMAAAELCPYLTKGPPTPTGLQHPHLVCTGAGGAVRGTGGCSGPAHPASHAQITVPRMFQQPWSLGRVCAGNTEGLVDQGKSQYRGHLFCPFLPTTPVGLESPSPWGWCEVAGLTGGANRVTQVQPILNPHLGPRAVLGSSLPASTRGCALPQDRCATPCTHI